MQPCSLSVCPPTTSAVPSSSIDNTEECFFEKWGQDVERAARSRAFDTGLEEDDAKDVVQDVQLRLLTVLRTKANCGDGYIRRTIRNSVSNCARGLCRHHARHCDFDARLADAIQVPPDPVDDPVYAADEESVAAIVSSLPLNLKQIYEAVYVEGLNQRAVAARMGISQPRVAQLHRLLQEKVKGLLVNRFA